MKIVDCSSTRSVLLFLKCTKFDEMLQRGWEWPKEELIRYLYIGGDPEPFCRFFAIKRWSIWPFALYISAGYRVVKNGPRTWINQSDFGGDLGLDLNPGFFINYRSMNFWMKFLKVWLDGARPRNSWLGGSTELWDLW